MTQVDKGISQIMASQEKGCFAIKTQNQGSKLVDPSESVFAGEALFVDGGIEQALASAFHSLAVARVLGNVGDDFVVKAYLVSRFGIEGAVGIEKCADKGQPQAFEALESLL